MTSWLVIPFLLIFWIPNPPETPVWLHTLLLFSWTFKIPSPSGMSLEWLYLGTMIKFLSLDFLGVSHRIPWKNKNVICRLEISALVLEILKFETSVKYANKITDDIIHLTQYFIINRTISKFAAWTIKTWLDSVFLHELIHF